MELSIVVPVYNVEDYLENCIHSLHDQGLETSIFEIILVNDGSIDQSLSVCQALAKQYPAVRIIDQSNSGLSAARNRGIDAAKGRYIYFIDSDDYLKSHYLNRFLQIALKEDLCFVGFSHFSTSKRFESSSEVPELDLVMKGSGLAYMAQVNFYNGAWWYMFKKERLNRLRFLDGRLSEDGIFTSELLQYVEKGAFYENKVYGYYHNPESILRTKNIPRLKKISDDMFFVVSAFNGVINQLPKESPYYRAVFNRLRHRQESYLFYAFVRFLRLKRSNTILKLRLEELEASRYTAYPIKIFDGYGNKRNQFLLKLFNSKFCLLSINRINRIIPIFN